MAAAEATAPGAVNLDWWFQRAAIDLTVAPEVNPFTPVSVPTPSSGPSAPLTIIQRPEIAWHTSVGSKSGAGLSDHMVATRDYAPGELIFSEIAVAIVPSTLLAASAPPMGAPAPADDAMAATRERITPLIQALELFGPFHGEGEGSPGDGRSALIRLVAQLLPTLSEGQGDNSDTILGVYRGRIRPCETRAEVLIRGLEKRGLEGNPMRPAPLVATPGKTSGTPSERSTAPTSVDAAAQSGPTASGGAEEGGGGAKPTLLATTPALTSLFVRTSFVSHSCLPNMSAVWSSDRLSLSISLLADVAIKRGDILTLPFTDTCADTLTRNIKLKAKYGFACGCERCKSVLEGVGLDDTIAVRCPNCSKGRFSYGGWTTSEAASRLVGSEVCDVCGIGAPDPREVLEIRDNVLRTFVGAADIPMLRAVLHDTDMGAFVRLFACLPELAKDGKREEAVKLSADVIAAAKQLRYFPKVKLLRLVTDHGILCGASEQVEESAKAWALAAELGGQLLKSTSPHIVEMYEAFAAKPPRNRVEAAAADRIRRLANTLG
jgi:hypothetical protein